MALAVQKIIKWNLISHNKATTKNQIPDQFKEILNLKKIQNKYFRRKSRRVSVCLNQN